MITIANLRFGVSRDQLACYRAGNDIDHRPEWQRKDNAPQIFAGIVARIRRAC